MQLGTLTWTPALASPELLAEPVRHALASWQTPRLDEVLVAQIDPQFADTQAMTDEYQIDLALSANCVLVAGKRSGEERFAACVVRATTRADVNNVVKRHLDVRKASFMPMSDAVAASGMEYGAITPIGLPPQYQLLIDEQVRDGGLAIIGSGIRGSKIVLPGDLLAEFPSAQVMKIAL